MVPENIKLLIKKYRANQCSDDEHLIVEKWYSELGGKENLILTDKEAKKIKPLIWDGIKDRTEIKETIEVKYKLYNNILLKPAIAASIILFLSIGIYLFFLRHETINSFVNIFKPNNQLVEYKNIYTKSQVITLSDHSVVTLFPNSEIKCFDSFTSQNRNVYLIGKAFFNVVKNPKRPFIVKTKDITTTVLGTSFTVEAYANQKNSIVIVKTGKVNVSKNQKNKTLTNNIVITPNQQVVFIASEGTLKKSIVEQPIAIITRKINFEDKPVTEVFSELEGSFGIRIIYPKELLKNCNVSVYFNKETLFEQLNIICKILGASYVVSETEIKIVSKGCNKNFK